jgi:hypothetical protein
MTSIIAVLVLIAWFAIGLACYDMYRILKRK